MTIEGPLFKISSLDSSIKLENCNPELVGGLLQTIFLKIGCQISLIENIDVSSGLVNGSIGTLTRVLFDSEKKPLVLLIKFEDYNGPVFVPEEPRIVPILRSERNYERDLKFIRIQFPVVLAFAMTIHKS